MSNISSTQTFASIDATDLADVTGGFGVPGWAKAAGKKALGVGSALLSVGDGYSNYQRARREGKGVGRSILEASNPFS